MFDPVEGDDELGLIRPEPLNGGRLD